MKREAKSNLEFAQEMRRSPTQPEKALWRHLKNRQIHGCRFRRQVPIGPFIVDFLCYDPKIIIELDGAGHDDQVAYDLRRKAWLESQGFRVLRFGTEIAISDGPDLLEVLVREIETLRRLAD